MPDTPQNSLLGKIAAYTEILSADPRSTIFVSLSETYRKMGMLEDAYSVAERGLANLPDYCPGHVVLARIQCQQGDLDGSARSFAKALECDPDSLAALVGFSRLRLLQQRNDDARGLLLKARTLSPADPVINKLLLSLPAEEAPAEIEEPENEAVVDKEPAAPKLPAAEPLESATLAGLYLKQGLTDKALDIYRNLLARDPDNLELRRRIRDLETASETSVPTSLAPAIEAQETLSTAGADSIPESIEQLPRPSEAVSGTPVLDQLNRLLVSIQKRRGDV